MWRYVTGKKIHFDVLQQSLFLRYYAFLYFFLFFILLIDKYQTLMLYKQNLTWKKSQLKISYIFFIFSPEKYTIFGALYLELHTWSKTCYTFFQRSIYLLTYKCILVVIEATWKIKARLTFPWNCRFYVTQRTKTSY